MKIDAVDFFYLAMPEILDIGDGSQDALLVRVTMDDGTIGYGECEASPLVSIAAWCTPMSHSACKPLSAAVLGYTVNKAEDIFKLTQLVRRNSFDLLQADHTLSGIDIALWDALGKKMRAPVWALLGYTKTFPKIAYASQLFGDSPSETEAKAKQVTQLGFRAAKFGWGPFGADLELDIAHIEAARHGLGDNIDLMIDAGTIWQNNVHIAKQRIPALQRARVIWLEEPFTSYALQSYAELASHCVSPLQCAGGEGAHDPAIAINMIDYAKLGYIQIDAGRIGGISSAFQVARYAQEKNVNYVNHTFTSSLALAASLQPYAGIEAAQYCEFPLEPSLLAQKVTQKRILPTSDGLINISDEAGLGMSIDETVLQKYKVECEIIINKKRIF